MCHAELVEASIKTNDMKNTLPKNWVTTSLFNLSNVFTGKKDANHSTEDGIYPFFTCAFDPLKSPDYSFDSEVLLLPGNGANVGEVFYFKGKFQAYQRTYIIDDIKINQRFLYYHLKTFWKIRNANQQFGSATNYIKIGNFKDFEVSFPPLAEQERIVTKLDALFAQHEKMKQALDKIPQLLKDFRQQVLTQSVTGKLTEEFIYENNLKLISIDRKEWYENEIKLAKTKKTKKPQKIVVTTDYDISFLEDKMGKPFDIGFIEEIAAKKNNALKAGPFGSSLKKEFYVESGYKIYGQEQVIKNDAHYGDYYINEERFQQLKSCEVQSGDLLISLVGTIGKVLVIPSKFEKGIINPRLLKFSFHENINPYFIKLYLESKIAKEFLIKNSHGGTMDVLNLGILKLLPIPIPSLAEQQEIVTRVESLFAKADAIEARYQTLKTKIDRLPQAILHKAFKGELVAQLPTDGDAKDLLAEIIQLKEEAKSKKGKKR